MRRLSPNGEPIPETLLKMDRDIVDRVVAEILETPTTIKWETIACSRESRRAGTGAWPTDERASLFRGARRAARAFAFRPAGHGQDPHRARGGVAVRRDVLLHQRIQLDEQVDRRGGEDGARALRRGGVRAGGDRRGRNPIRFCRRASQTASTRARGG